VEYRLETRAFSRHGQTEVSFKSFFSIMNHAVAAKAVPPMPPSNVGPRISTDGRFESFTLLRYSVREPGHWPLCFFPFPSCLTELTPGTPRLAHFSLPILESGTDLSVTSLTERWGVFSGPVYFQAFRDSNRKFDGACPSPISAGLRPALTIGRHRPPFFPAPAKASASS